MLFSKKKNGKNAAGPAKGNFLLVRGSDQRKLKA
jgi:hypothetical protein